MDKNELRNLAWRLEDHDREEPKYSTRQLVGAITIALAIVALIGLGAAIAFPAKCERSVTAGTVLVLNGCAR